MKDERRAAGGVPEGGDKNLERAGPESPKICLVPAPKTIKANVFSATLDSRRLCQLTGFDTCIREGGGEGGSGAGPERAPAGAPLTPWRGTAPASSGTG